MLATINGKHLFSAEEFLIFDEFSYSRQSRIKSGAIKESYFKKLGELIFRVFEFENDVMTTLKRLSLSIFCLS